MTKPLEPSRFRSPLLKALPAAPPRRGRRQMWWRRRLVAGLLVVVAAPLLAIAFEGLPKTGVGYVFYWIHDFLYLPLRGYLFTWALPGSWIYLLAAATLLAFGVYAYAVARRPSTPGWHASLGRRILSRRLTRPLLLRWMRAFKSWQASWRERAERSEKRRFLGPWIRRCAAALDGPTLLEEVITHECEEVFERVDVLDPRSPDAAATLEPAVALSVLAARGQTHARRSDVESLTAVTRLDQALLRLDLVAVASLASPEAAEAIAPLRQELEGELEALLRPLLPSHPRPPGFSPRTSAGEIALVLDLGLPQTWPRHAAVRRRRVLDGIEGRRRQLDETRRLLESWSQYGRRRRVNEPEELRCPTSALEARLALDVALFAALRLNAARLALAFLESLEGLRFALMTAGGVAESTPFLDAVSDLPALIDYRICAHLAERGPAEDANAVVSHRDFEVLLMRQADLHTAAAEGDGRG